MQQVAASSCKSAFFIDGKPNGKRTQMREVSVYTVEGGKVVREEYLYQLP